MIDTVETFKPEYKYLSIPCYTFYSNHKIPCGNCSASLFLIHKVLRDSFERVININVMCCSCYVTSYVLSKSTAVVFYKTKVKV